MVALPVWVGVTLALIGQLTSLLAATRIAPLVGIISQATVISEGGLIKNRGQRWCYRNGLIMNNGLTQGSGIGPGVCNGTTAL